MQKGNGYHNQLRNKIRPQNINQVLLLICKQLNNSKCNSKLSSNSNHNYQFKFSTYPPNPHQHSNNHKIKIMNQFNQVEQSTRPRRAPMPSYGLHHKLHKLQGTSQSYKIKIHLVGRITIIQHQIILKMVAINNNNSISIIQLRTMMNCHQLLTGIRNQLNLN